MQPMQPGQVKPLQCPNCQSAVVAGANYCLTCGYPLVVLPAPLPVVTGYPSALPVEPIKANGRPVNPLYVAFVATLAALVVCASLGVFAFNAYNQAHVQSHVHSQANASGQATCNLHTHVCTRAPSMTIDPKKTYIATIHTAKGDIVIKLDAKDTPSTVNNFVFLAQQHFYDGTYFWRVEMPGQPSVLDGQPSTLDLIQGGSVAKNGEDSSDIPGYRFQDEPFPGTYTTGTVAMANSGPNTNANQFFIDTGDNSSLPRSYTIFGAVTSGMNVAQRIMAGDTILSVTIQVE